MPALDNGLGDHPERNFHTQSPWFKDFVIFILLDILVSTIIVLQQIGTGYAKLVDWAIPFGSTLYYWLPIYQFAALHVFVLFSLLIGEFSLQEGTLSKYRLRRRIANACRYTLIVSLLVVICTALYVGVLVFAVYGFYGLYIICALVTPYVPLTPEVRA